jgi:hypothetical protein
MFKQKKENLCIAADAFISAVLMIMGYIFTFNGGADSLSVILGIGSIAVPIFLILYAFLQKKLLLTTSLGIKTIIIAYGAITSIKGALEYNAVGFAEIVILALAVIFLLMTLLSLKGFSFRNGSILSMILFAIGTVVICINVYESISMAAEMKTFFGTNYYVSVVLQTLEDIFLWVAVFLVGFFNRKK